MSCKFVASDQPRILSGRHNDPCTCDGVRGCQPCPEVHCVICGREHAKSACVGCLEAARSDLGAIWDLCCALPGEAAVKGAQSEAMMLMGPSADPEAWRNYAMSAVRGRLCRCATRTGRACPSMFGRPCPDAAYVDDCRDEQHPLWVLGSWEQIWRDFLDHPTDAPITIEAAYAYLDLQMGYMADQVEPAFDEFARELRGCRAHLENVLVDGVRTERGHVPCIDCEMRLMKVYGKTEPDDHWTCGKCHRVYTAEEYTLAQRHHMDNDRGDRFLKVSEALGMINRPEQTLRAWMSAEKVQIQRDPKTGALLVWWPDVRDMDRNTPTRKRRSA